MPTILAPAVLHLAARDFRKGNPVALANLSPARHKQSQNFRRQRVFELTVACSTFDLMIHTYPHSTLTVRTEDRTPATEPLRVGSGLESRSGFTSRRFNRREAERPALQRVQQRSHGRQHRSVEHPRLKDRNRLTDCCHSARATDRAVPTQSRSSLKGTADTRLPTAAPLEVRAQRRALGRIRRVRTTQAWLLSGACRDCVAPKGRGVECRRVDRGRDPPP
jgi:hypothetical protein